MELLSTWLGPVWWPAVYETSRVLAFIFAIVVPLMLAVAYLTLWERKFIGWVQIRIGPNRVGPLGLLQPIADGIKLLMSDINAGLLYILALSSISVYGVIIAGWASNSKYAFLGAMRSAAQMVSYELAMGFALVVVLMVSGSLNLSDIVEAQAKGWFANKGLTFLSWNWLPLLPMLVVYFVSGVAETNRGPFDVVEGESEIVAGHMIEYSGMTFALFFLAEYMNMILISTLTAVLFFGGWQAPIDSIFLNWIPPFGWLMLKIFVIVSMFLWIRATFPRYRYDQIMRLGWKVFIPLTLIWIAVIGIWMQTPWSLWK